MHNAGCEFRFRITKLQIFLFNKFILVYYFPECLKCHWDFLRHAPAEHLAPHRTEPSTQNTPVVNGFWTHAAVECWHSVCQELQNVVAYVAAPLYSMQYALSCAHRCCYCSIDVSVTRHSVLCRAFSRRCCKISQRAYALSIGAKMNDLNWMTLKGHYALRFKTRASFILRLAKYRNDVSSTR